MSQDLNQDGLAPSQVPLSTSLCHPMGTWMEWKQTRESSFLPPSYCLSSYLLLPLLLSLSFHSSLSTLLPLSLSVSLSISVPPLLCVYIVLFGLLTSLFFFYALCCLSPPNSFYVLMVSAPLHLQSGHGPLWLFQPHIAHSLTGISEYRIQWTKSNSPLGAPAPTPSNPITCGCVWSHEEINMVAHAGPGLGQPLRMMPSEKSTIFIFIRKTVYQSILSQISLPIKSLACARVCGALGVMILMHLSPCVGDSSARVNKWESCLAPSRKDKWADGKAHLIKEEPRRQEEATEDHGNPCCTSVETCLFNKPESSVCVGGKRWKPEERRCLSKQTRGTQ